MICLDTHVLVWLYAGHLDKLSNIAKTAIEENELCISPMVMLELEYLRRKGVLTVTADTVYQELHQSIGLVECAHSFSDIIRQAITLDWTGDPFDRIIVAHAMAMETRLLSKDRNILDHAECAFWQ